MKIIEDHFLPQSETPKNPKLLLSPPTASPTTAFQLLVAETSGITPICKPHMQFTVHN